MAYKNILNETGKTIAVNLYPRLGLAPYGGQGTKHWTTGPLSCTYGPDNRGTIDYGDDADNMYIDGVEVNDVNASADSTPTRMYAESGERGQHWDNELNSHDTIRVFLNNDGVIDLAMIDSESGPYATDASFE